MNTTPFQRARKVFSCNFGLPTYGRVMDSPFVRHADSRSGKLGKWMVGGWEFVNYRGNESLSG